MISTCSRTKFLHIKQNSQSNLTSSLRQGLFMLFWLSSNSQQSSCLCFPSIRNKEVSHCALFQKSQLNCQLRTKPLIHKPLLVGTSYPGYWGLGGRLSLCYMQKRRKPYFLLRRFPINTTQLFLLCHLGFVKKFSVLAKCDCRQIWKISNFKHHLNLVIEHLVCAKP